MMLWRVFGLSLLAIQPSTAAVSVLVEGSHANGFVAPAINAVSSGLVDTSIFVDWNTLNATIRASDLTDTSATWYESVATNTQVNHAPYLIGNVSYGGYNANTDGSNYASLVAAGGTYVQPLAAAFNGALPAGTQPPALMLVPSSQNSGNGGSNWGIEFGLSTSYKGLDTSEDSWVSAETAGLAAVLAFNHPTWNIWDIKAALRVTASNWATGYNHTTFGYGLINWDNANAGPTLYLQPPSLVVSNFGYYAQISLYPFRQTRRNHEVVYSVNSAYVWPLKNEYTASDIAASGGTLMFTSNGTDVTSTIFYAPATSGTITVVAFTTDGAGNFSRVEEFSKHPITLTIGTACLAP